MSESIKIHVREVLRRVNEEEAPHYYEKRTVTRRDGKKYEQHTFGWEKS